MQDKTFHESTDDFLQNQRLIALYSDIGRGHPSYLDSLLIQLKKKYPNIVCRTVFEESKGISLWSWRLLFWLYRISGKGGLATKFYHLVRRRSPNSSSDSFAIKILGRDLKRRYNNYQGICLVDHPILAKTLTGVCRVWYVHGEIAAPEECVIPGVEKTLVPLEETKQKLAVCGAGKETIEVCGLMIEPGLVDSAEISYKRRLVRINSGQSLTVGFFTSGAYPKEHMEKIILGARSVIEVKMKAIIFCGTNPHNYEWVRNEFKNSRIRVVEDNERAFTENFDFDLLLVFRKTRQEDTQRVVELFPHLDAFVAASHERTNWVVGLGLPMFVLFPLIGTFASQNFEFAQEQKVVCPLDTQEKAKNLGEILLKLRQNGQMLEMARNGFGVHKIDGVEIAVSDLYKTMNSS
ncbi:MAG TPA: hypothetical protein VF369_01365 [candidate division Zixibacteria bacterium]